MWKRGSSTIASGGQPDFVISFQKEAVAVSPDRVVCRRSKRVRSIVKQEEPTGTFEQLEKDDAPRGCTRPTAEECQLAVQGLAKLHPEVVGKNNSRRRQALLESCGSRDSVTDCIVSTMLSQNTTSANSTKAFRRLKQLYPTWDMVVECQELTELEDAIRSAGLAKRRAQRIHSLLETVQKERGSTSFDYVRELSDEEIKRELGRFKGLGPKTISCVLLFCLARPEFPVDTHVLRISKALKWIPSSATRESAYDYLNATVPNELKLDLHCLLVTHGKHCHRCAANGKPQFPPKDGSKLVCPLANLYCSPKVKQEKAKKKVVVKKEVEK